MGICLPSQAERPDGPDAAGGSPAADEAAAALETVISDAAPDQVVNLDKASHAVARPLWQQRTFTQAAGRRIDMRISACANLLDLQIHLQRMGKQSRKKNYPRECSEFADSAVC